MYKSALKIVQTLQNAGYTAYFAGGCVRDMLLDINPKDYDIATNATPEEIEKLIPHTVPVGKSFGVILAKRGKHMIEIASFRKDIAYKDGRRPSEIAFTDEKEDAQRRDFTINGMFFDPLEKRFINYVEGKKDLEQKFLRFIGNAEERIQEDHLRILRAVRFKNTLDFAYDPETYKALKKHAKLIKKLSTERVREELIKCFSQPNIVGIIKDFDSLGLLKILIPELLELKGIGQSKEFHAEGDVWAHTLRCVESLPKTVDYIVRLGTLFHDIAKPQTQSRDKQGKLHFYGHEHTGGEMVLTILKRLGFSRKDQEIISWLVRHHLMYDNIFEMTERRREHWFRMEYFSHLLEVMRADAKGCIPTHIKDWTIIHQWYENWKKEEIKKEAMKAPLDGADIMEHFSLPTGKQVGELLQKATEAFLDEKIHTKKEALTFLKQELQKKQ